MLLTNFVAEQFIFNGFIGDLIDIKFADPAGPKADKPKGYVIVNFPLSNIPADKAFISGLPITYIPVPMVKMRREKKCCKIEIEIFPLPMAIGLTGHKAQSMTIAKDDPFKKAVLHFPTPTSTTRNTSEYVMTGRAKTLTDFAIGNKVADLDRSKILKIDTMPKNVERREFQQMVKERYERVDLPHVKAETAAVDTVEVKRYKGGSRFLRKWYCEKFWNWPSARPNDWPL